MVAGSHPISDIFNNYRIFEIPYYQRAYVWKENNWERFLEDVQRVSQINKPYFVGSFIFKQKITATGKEAGDRRIVIDGQQRITTIIVFFKVLSLMKGKPQIFERFLVNLSDESDEKEIALHHNHIDSAAFAEIVSLSELKNLSVFTDGNTKSDLNQITRLYEYFRTHIDVDKMNSDRIKKNLLFVTIDLDHGENEQQIFDTINSLGVSLTTSELLKNYLFDEDNESDFKKYWKPIFEKDEEQKRYWDQIITSGTKTYHLVDYFLYALILIKVRSKAYNVSAEDKSYFDRYDNLFDSYKDFTEKYLGDDGKDKLMKFIYEAAITFMSKFRPNCRKEAVTSEPGFERVNLMLFGLDYTVMLPYVLYVVLNAAPEEQTAIFTYLETYIMRRSIARLETRGYSGLFQDGLIQNEVLTAKALKAYVHREEDKDVSYRAATQDEVRNGVNNIVFVNRQALGFIYMLESRLRSDKTSATMLYGIGTYSLEHLMPKRWKEKWQVPEDETLANETNAALYTIGNLAIIPGALNSSISNADWQTKLSGKGEKAGLRQNAQGLITLNKYLDQNVWDLKSIQQRAKDLYDYILRVWNEPWDCAETDDSKQ